MANSIDWGTLARQRPYSIRTRIKTYTAVRLALERISQRPYSIRTRIKTPGAPAEHLGYFIVRDHIPLEQGLRPV